MQRFSQDKFYSSYTSIRQHFLLSLHNPGQEAKSTNPRSHPAPWYENIDSTMFKKVLFECSGKVSSMPSYCHAHFTLSLEGRIQVYDQEGGRWSVEVPLAEHWQTLSQRGSTLQRLPFQNHFRSCSQSNDLLLVATRGLLFMFDFLNPAKAVKKA